MLETLRDLLLDPVLRIRLFTCSLGVYTQYPTLFICDCLLYFFRLFYFTSTLFSKEDNELTYGESVYGSLDTLFDIYQTPQHAIFCDIGSGLGKAVLFADKCRKLTSIGVEIKSPFISVSRILSKVFLFKRSTFLLQDFREDLPSADIYLSPNTCLSQGTLQSLTDQLSSKPGSIVFSISEPLPFQKSELLGKHSVFFSWGKATVYVQRVCDTL